MKQIVIVARQAGTASAFLPVVRAIAASWPPEAIAVFAYPAAARVWSCAGVVSTEVKAFAEAEPLLRGDRETVLLLTGTSLEIADDATWWSWARERNIPSVAFVDQWVNYWQRFSSDPAGKLRFDVLPDRIAVVDGLARERMVELGCPRERLVITGTPAVDLVRQVPTKASAVLRAQLLTGRDGAIVLWAGEPAATGCAATSPDALIAVLLAALEEIGDASGRAIHLVLKPHPRQIESGEILLATGTQLHGVALSCSAADRLPLLHAVDVVAGHQSMLLYEAAIARKPVVSLQLGTCTGHDLTAHAGIHIVRDVLSLASALEHAVHESLEAGRDALRLQPPADATARFLSALDLS